MYNNPLQPPAMRERYSQLPANITDLFEYGTVDLLINNIATEYLLSADQKTALRMEIELVLYLFVPRTGMVERLQESLGVDRMLAEQIAVQIEEDLFIIVDDVLSFVETQFSEEAGNTSLKPQEESDVNPITESGTPSTAKPEVDDSVEKTIASTAAVKPMQTLPEDFNTARAHSYGAFRPENDDNDPDEPTHSTHQEDMLRK